ncbi:Ig-like domain-containing protein [Tellurirhabdus bombi]|uniref:Ig-like domain-containing protein n=1 Tax=Tellurirhabdus bombi TaxID=2907205 RepID=UPI001F4712C9|nr:gliding motility-associated C-terminal domain-containing protein [Tellurirhabdus bombi]
MYKKISTQKPKIGDIITFTLVVGNDGGVAANGIIVQDSLLAGGARFTTQTVLRGGGSLAFGAMSGKWNVGTIAPGDSAVLEIKAKVEQEGVYFAAAEVIAAQGSDLDSQPNNWKISEDDYGSACFSVPIIWNPGDEFRASIPSNFTGTQWSRNGQPITAQYPSDTAVASGETLLIKAPGIYTFVTSSGQCPANGCCPIEVVAGPCLNPVLITAQSATICAGSVATLNATSPGNTIRWYTVSSGGTPFATVTSGTSVTALPGSSTTYYAEAVTAAGCLSERTAVPVTVNALPQVSISPTVNGVLCQQGTITLAASITPSGGYSYAWQGPNGFSSSLAQPSLTNAQALAGGSYRVVVSTPGGCSASAVTSITSTTCPSGEPCQLAVTARASSASVCVGSSLGLVAEVSGGVAPYQYGWRGPNGFVASGASASVPSASSLATGSYTVEVRDAQGCSATAVTASVLVKACDTGSDCNPQISSTSICVGNTLVLTANGSYNSYLWRGPNGFSSTQPTVTIPNATVSMAGSYSLAVTGPNGCSGTAVAEAVVKPQPTISASASTTAICIGGSITLNVSLISPISAQQYLWTGPDGFSSTSKVAVVSNVQNSGTYKITLTDNTGCSASALVGITVYPKPTVSIQASPVCTGSPLTLTAVVAGNASSYQYSWQGPNGFTSSEKEPTIAAANSTHAGSYSVVVSDAMGCTVVASTSVTVGSQPLASNNGPACVGGSVQLSATAGASSYLWSGPNGFQSTQQSPVLTNVTSAQAGNYSVVVGGVTGCSGAATTTVIVNASPQVSITSTVNGVLCQEGTITLAATITPSGGYSYAWQGPNGFSSSLAQPSLTNAQALAGGSYRVVVSTPGGCSASAVTSITSTTCPSGEPCQLAVTARASSASVCVGSSLGLVAEVSGGVAPYQYGWRGPNGFVASGASASVPSASSLATGSYTVEVRDAQGCSATAVTASVLVKACDTGSDCDLNVSPPVVTCAVTHICLGDEVKLHAANCAGTVIWSNGKTGASILITPTATTTYTAKCQVGNCLSPESNTETIYVNDPQPPVVTAETDTICVGGQVRLTATGCDGKIIWSTGVTGASILVSPTAATTYYANCRLGNCISNPSEKVTIYIGPPATPRIISSTQAICPGGAATLTVANCSGTPVWSTGETTASISVSPLATTTYSVVCKSGTCVSPRSGDYAITVTKPDIPTVVANADTVCVGGNVLLTATNCAGTVIWSTGASGTSLSVNPTTNISYSAYCKVGTCNSEMSNPVQLVVVNPSTPLIKTTNTLICAGEKVTLTAEGCNGTVIWSNGMIGASIADMPGKTTNYFANCKIGSCTSPASNTIAVNVNNSAAPKPTVVASTTAICKGTNVTLTASGCAAGTIVWSTGESGSSIVVSPTATTDYYAACKMGAQCNSQPSVVKIVVNTPPTPKIYGCNCSKNEICPGDSVPLMASGCTGTLLWSNGATSTSIVVSPTVTTEYTVVCKGAVCTSDPSPSYTVVVGEPAAPIVTASKTEFDEGETVTLTAVGCEGGQIIWSTGATGSSIVVAPTASTSYYAQCRKHGCLSNPTVIELRKKGDCDLVAPITSASALTVCRGGSVTLTATACSTGATVVWSNGMTGTSITVNDIQALTQFTAVCKRDELCSSEASAPISVDVTEIYAPTVVATKPMICPGDTTTLTALGCAGTVIWSTGATGSSITVQPANNTDYWAKCESSACASAPSPGFTIRVGTPNAPTVSASVNTICLGASVTLTASACDGGSVVWSTGAMGNQIIVSPTSSTTYTAVCRTAANCLSAPSNGAVILVNPPLSKPVTIAKTNACPFNTVDLNAAVTSQPSVGGRFEFHTENSVSSAVVGNPSAVGSGMYYVFEKSASGCHSEAGIIHVQVTDCNSGPSCTTNPATAVSGTDATICAAKEYKLSGKIGGAATSSVWTTSGTGTFDNALLVNATYIPSQEDVKTGFVTLTLTTNDPDASGSCQAAKSSMKLTIKGVAMKPAILMQNSPTLCAGDSILLKAYPDGYKYLWSTGATTQSIQAKTSGIYSVQLVDAEGCTSVKSDTVRISIGAPILPPQVPSLARNDCPGKTVNLLKLITSQPRTEGGVFEFHAGPSPTSPVVLRPDSVGQGTYYIFERSNNCCYSTGSPVKVNIFNCAADSCRPDVYIAKTADKLYPKVGEVVTYTIKVGNKGTCSATNVDFVDVLPNGLELESEGNCVKNPSGNLVALSTSLAPGEIREYFYKTRVRKRGELKNDVSITYLDQIDPDTTNNRASVTIRDTTAVVPMYVGLAKKALEPIKQSDGNYTFGFVFNVTNYSPKEAKGVQVTDDLSKVFAPHMVTAIDLANQGTSLKLNNTYNGMAGNVQLLDTTSRVEAGKTESFTLTVSVHMASTSDSLMTFYNQAKLTAKLDTISVSDVSTEGEVADADGDGNPYNDDTPTAIKLNGSMTKSQLGVALSVVNMAMELDSSYLVTYKITVKNFGAANLTNVQLSDSLSKSITAPAGFTVAGAPTVAAGSSLIPNPDYNGDSNPTILLPSSHLPAGGTDSVLVSVRIQPNGLTGAIYTQVIGTGLYNDTLVTDVSNNGIDPEPVGSVKTPVRFDLPASMLGVAKSVGLPIEVSEGVYDIPYTIKLTNMGATDLKRVQVEDNLSETFEKHGAVIVSDRIALITDPGLVADTTYTGRGGFIRLLNDSLSVLPKRTSRTVSFLVRVDVRNADSVQFNNSALGLAYTENGVMVADTSTSGTDPDPDNDLDPRNNSLATLIILNGVSTTPYIGVALSVKDTARMSDGSFKVVYQIVVKNYSKIELTNVQLSDSLAQNVFNATTGASFVMAGSPIVSAGSELVPNPQFNGDSDTRILNLDSRLAAGKTDTVYITVRVRTDGRSAPYLNTVVGEGLAGTQKVQDTSTEGVEPDLNGNGNPTDDTESVATALVIPSGSDVLFIPEGFSPNGDGINDYFIIQNTNGATVSLEVYNRWGHAVYKNDNYENDWDGKSNTGALVGSTSNGVPDGTYFYVVRLSDGRKYVRYMTINR